MVSYYFLCNGSASFLIHKNHVLLWCDSECTVMFLSVLCHLFKTYLMFSQKGYNNHTVKEIQSTINNKDVDVCKNWVILVAVTKNYNKPKQLSSRPILFNLTNLIIQPSNFNIPKKHSVVFLRNCLPSYLVLYEEIIINVI